MKRNAVLRERLEARDNNTLPSLRRGQEITFGEWAEFVFGELFHASDFAPRRRTK